MEVKLPSVETVFDAALDIIVPAERAAYLDRACGGDDALRRQVESLLDAHLRAGKFLAAPALSPPVTVTAAGDSRPLEGPGEVIGPYKLLEEIGEGGMGTVYMAEQSRPIRRKVALKVIKPGMDTKQVIARFEAERQALALMDHPNIAKVLDAGATASGRPFFVMELVRGIPITDYCDREHLTISERLELFILVCRAVQHAHMKGIIHRDLKPSNVLVMVVDGVGVPKVIDFGVAKATGQSLTERTLFTGFHQFVGTPLYMSPEQADLAGVDVDTRSDVYALGVLLYELLTGTTPLDRETFRKAAFDEVRRMVREVEPQKPSTRLSSLGETLSSISAKRKAETRHLSRSVRGELDWIVMKTLEKDRNRRYETANGLAADVLRYLTGRPVEAGPPSRWYRFMKHARRNRVALSTACLVAMACLVGIMASTWQARRALTAEKKAIAAKHQGEEHLALAFEALEGQYERVADQWLGDVLWLPLPQPFLTQTLPFFERFAREGGTDPTVGRASRRVGEILIQLNRMRDARTYLRQSESVWQALLAKCPSCVDYSRDLAACYETDALMTLGWSKRQLIFQDAIRIREDIVGRFPENTLYARELANSHRLYGSWATSYYREIPAEKHLNRAKTILEGVSNVNPGDPDVLCDLGETLTKLGELFHRMMLLDKSEVHARRSAVILDELVARHPTRSRYRLAAGWNDRTMGQTLIGMRRFQDAIPFATRGEVLFEGLRADYPDAWSLPWEVSDHLVTQTVAMSVIGQATEAGKAVGRLGGLGKPRIRSQSLAEIAWHLTCLSEPTPQGGLARQCTAGALELEPDSMLAWHVLGLIHSRAGHWDDAIEVLTRANQLEQNPAYPINGFLLAMAFHHKGDAARARSWFDLAVDRMAHPDESIDIYRLSRFVYVDLSDFARYRDEAAMLLNIDLSEPAKNASPVRKKPSK